MGMGAQPPTVPTSGSKQVGTMHPEPMAAGAKNGPQATPGVASFMSAPFSAPTGPPPQMVRRPPNTVAPMRNTGIPKPATTQGFQGQIGQALNPNTGGLGGFGQSAMNQLGANQGGGMDSPEFKMPSPGGSMRKML